MSSRVTGIVWECEFPRLHKMVLLALAEYADPDGEQAGPSVARLEFMTGYEERAIRRTLSNLIDHGFIAVTGSRTGGRGSVTEYRINLSALPYRNWRRMQKDADSSTFPALASVKVNTPSLIPTSPLTLIAPGGVKEGDDARKAPGKRASKAHRLPEDWRLTDDLRRYASEKGLTAEEIDFAEEDFRTYWYGSGGTKVDWGQTWRNRVMRLLADKRRADASYGARRSNRAERLTPSSDQEGVNIVRRDW